jgi:hypothetical protein
MAACLNPPIENYIATEIATGKGMQIAHVQV